LVSSISLANGGSITNRYDSLGRLLSTKLLNSSRAVLDSEAYTYDPASYRTQQVFTASNYINYTYDNIGQLTSAKGLEGNGTTNRLHEQFGYGYDKAGNLLQKTNREFIESFQYTKANALTNIGFNGWLTVAGAASSQVTNISAIYAAAFIGYANGLVYFNPDPVYLYKDGTFAVYPDDHQAWYWTGSSYVYLDYPNYYTNNPVVTNYATVLYDLVFNTKQGTQTTSTNYLTPEYPGTYLYDQNGNLTNDILRSYGYDSENQLTNVTVAGSWRSDFIYDGLGRRRIERDYTWTNSAWSKTNEIRFVYDRNLLIQDRDANNHVLVTYTRGLDLGGGIQRAGGIGGLLARTDGNNNDSFYHADGSGNIMALMSGAQQTLVAQYLYNPFGQIEGQWGGQATANEMQFSSMPFHNLSGFSLYPFRAYNPNIQRWLNQDPIQERGGINLYRFVRNNPLSNFDPFGLQGFGNFGTGQVSQQNVDNPSTVQFNTGNAYVDNRPKNLFPNYSPIPPVQASNPNAFMGNTDDNSFLNAFGSLVFNPDAQDAVNDLINNNLLAQTAKICKNAKKPGPDDPFLQLLNLYGGFAGPAGSLVGDFAGKMSSNPNVDAMNKALDAAAEISLDKALSFPKEKGTDIMREEMYK
jgi:RHS repeat-associated protein